MNARTQKKKHAVSLGFAITPEGMVVSSKTLKSTKGAAKACERFIRAIVIPRPRTARRCSGTCPGVDVFFVDGARPEPQGARGGEFEIERCDDCGVFEDDGEAIRFLLALGAPGVASCRRCFGALHQCATGDPGCLHCERCGENYPPQGAS